MRGLYHGLSRWAELEFQQVTDWAVPPLPAHANCPRELPGGGKLPQTPDALPVVREVRQRNRAGVDQGVTSRNWCSSRAKGWRLTRCFHSAR